MKLEQQVTNLELSRKLKELGVKQESLWYWKNYNNRGWELQTKPTPSGGVQEISAFTVAELGEILRPYLQRDIWLRDDIGEAMKQATYMEDEANARARMFIYLIENDLIGAGSN